MPTAFPLGELAELIDAEVEGDPGIPISGIKEPAEAGPTDLAPLFDRSRVEVAAGSAAAALLVPLDLTLPGRNLLRSSEPRRALGLLLRHLLGEERRAGRVDPQAAVDAAARVDPTAWVGPFVYLAAGAVIGEGSWIEPFTYVGEGARVGRHCRLGPGATILAGCEVGDGVVLGPGAVIGGQGFGFWRGDAGWERIPSAARVILEEGVEIGANSCVDRGTLRPTRIGRGVKVDNLVQVGHNVVVGADSLLCAQVGLAGSVEVGEACVLGGQVGVADHLRVGAGARVGARSGVAQPVPPGAEVSGYPAIPHRRWLRASLLFARLGELQRELRELGRQVAALGARR